MLFKMLNMYGDGVHKFEEVVWGEMERLIKELEAQEGEDIQLSHSLGRSLKIVIYILVKKNNNILREDTNIYSSDRNFEMII